MDGLVDDILQDVGKNEVSSVSVLREALERLTEEELKLKCMTYTHGLNTFQQDRPGDEAVAELEERMQEMLKSPGAQVDVLQNVINRLQEYRLVQSNLQRLHLLQSSAKVSAELEHKLKEFQHHIHQGSYSDAGWCILGLQQSLVQHGVVGGVEEKDIPQGLLFLAKQVEDGRRGLSQVLQEKLQSCVELDPLSYSVGVRLGVTNEVWRGLEVVGQLQDSVEHVGDSVFVSCLGPLLASGIPEVKVIVRKSEHGSACLWKALDEGVVDKEAVGKLEAVGKILEYVAENLFLGIGTLTQIVGDKIWSKLKGTYLQQISSKVEGMEDVEALTFLDSEAALARNLELIMIRLGYLSEGDDTLHEAISSVGEGCLNAFPLTYLSRARDLISSPEWEGVEVGKPLVINRDWILRQMDHGLEDWEVVDPDCGLDLEKYVLGRGIHKISQTAVQLYALMKEILKDACQAGSVLISRVLCHAVRDIAVLYCCLPPALHSDQLEVPQVSLLFCNDCQYLADQLILLPHTITLPAELLASEGSLDFTTEAMKLRACAQTVMEKQVSKQSEAFQEVLDQVNAFTNLRTGQEGIAMRRAAMQLTQLAVRLGRVMKDVMAIGEHIALASLLIESTMSRILSSLMSQSDISAQESAELPKVLHPLLQEIPCVILSILQQEVERFKSKSQGDSKQLLEAPGSDISWVMWKLFCDHCPSLMKLEKLVQIFDARLSVIVEWWESSELQRTGFTVQEIRRLIWALFEHSEFREECIQRIESGI